MNLVSRRDVGPPFSSGDGSSESGDISGDGRYVVFTSYADNLIKDDTNGTSDLFVKDMTTGSITRISSPAPALSVPSTSADGRYVALVGSDDPASGDTNSFCDILVKDLVTGSTAIASTDSAGRASNGYSDFPSISGNGRYVAFVSYADNLVRGDSSHAPDVFVKDLATGIITRVSTDSAGREGNSGSNSPSISADGRYVAFASDADNLVGGDTNGLIDVFVKDLSTGITTGVGTVGERSYYGSFGDMHLSMSADGRHVAFASYADTLVSGDTNGQPDIFVKDLSTGITTRASTDSAGQEGNLASDGPSISADGRFVAFWSRASNLVSGDGNSAPDVFMKDLKTGKTMLISKGDAGTAGNGASLWPSVSADGRYVAFHSGAHNLYPVDPPGVNVFRWQAEPPTASAAPPNVSIPGGTSYVFTVTYEDDDAIRVSTLDSSDVVVTGPQGFSQPAVFDHVDVAEDGSPRTATYRITPPGGAWSPADDGTYTVWLQADEVKNSLGVSAPAGALGTFVVHAAQEAVDLGTVDYRDLPGLDPSGADLWYRFQTARAGFVSARAALAPDATGDFSVTLFDAQWNALISAGATAGAAQADWQAAAGGETYFVRLSGNVGNLDLRLANLVRRTGSKVAVAGTATQDVFECAAAPARHVTINGLTYPFDPAAVSIFTFDGRGGPDAALVTDSTGNANVDLGPGAVWVRDTAAGVSVYMTLTGSITVDGGGGTSTARLYDSPGDDTFTGRPGHCVLQGNGFFLGAVGFRYVFAYATAGGQDTAVLDDSPGNDVFTADPVRHYAVLYGAGFYHRVDSFDSVEASSAEGIDIAKLYDSAGNDTFVADATSARLSGEGFSNQANKFRYAIGFGSSGTDTAIFNGSAETDSFVGTPTYAVLSGETYTDRVSSFDTVTANGTPGGADVARLYDSGGDDTFVAYPTEATLSGPGFSNQATNFRYVQAYSTTGGTDAADLYDSSGNDTFVAYPSYGALYATSFYNRANYFDSVVAHSSAGNDLAKLYDSPGDDTFDAYLAYAVLSGAGFSNRVEGFRYVTAYSDMGGSDTATLHGSAGDETITGTYEYTRLQGGSTDITARSFEKTFVPGGSGGQDKATLYDSSGDDRLDAAGTWAKLSYPDRFIYLSDLAALARVKAVSSQGGQDTKHTTAIDYVLETQGPWTAI